MACAAGAPEIDLVRQEAAVVERPQQIVEPLRLAVTGGLHVHAHALLRGFLGEPARVAQARVRSVLRQHVEIDAQAAPSGSCRLTC